MATEAQVRANRNNSLKSTGPRSLEGKERSRRNSLKHGLTATEAVLSIEDRVGYEELRAQLIVEHQPVGTQELLLVTQIAFAFSRIQRGSEMHLATFERGLTEHESATPAMTKLDVFEHESATFDKLRRYEASANSVYFRALAQLQKLQNARRSSQNRARQQAAANPPEIIQITPADPEEIGFVSSPAPASSGLTSESCVPNPASSTKIEVLPRAKHQEAKCPTRSSTCIATPTTPSSTAPAKSSA